MDGKDRGRLSVHQDPDVTRLEPPEGLPFPRHGAHADDDRARWWGGGLWRGGVDAGKGCKPRNGKCDDGGSTLLMHGQTKAGEQSNGSRVRAP